MREISSLSETISDALGRDKENPCYHNKVIDTTPDPGTWSLSLTTPNGYTRTWRGFGSSRFDSARSSIPNIVRDDANWYTMYQSALPGMTQQVDESLANFVRDLPALRSIPDIVRRLGKIPTLLKKVVRGKGRKRNSKAILSALASANLGYHFGVLPLDEEIRKIYSVAHSVHRRFKDLKAKANQVQRRRIRFNCAARDLHYVGPDVATNWVSCSGSVKESQGRIKCTSSLISDVRFLSIRYKYQMPKLPNWLAMTLGAMDELGLNFNPRIIWDALRYSFVVDWFVKVSPFISQFQRPMLPLGISILKCTHSEKYVIRQTADWESVLNFAPQRCCDRIITTYRRCNGTPPLDQLRLSGNVDWFKVHIGASLLMK